MSKQKTTEKIIEANYWFKLHGEKLKVTQEHLKISYLTLKKYIKIGTELEFTLFELLDGVGKDKLTLDLAITIIDNARNPESQVKLYSELKGIKKKDRKGKIDELIECPICCVSHPYQESFHCCGEFICIDCIYKHLDVSVNDHKFEGFKCPLCTSYLVKSDIYHLFNLGKEYNKTFWLRETPHFNYNRRKYRNIYLKSYYAIKEIERLTNRKMNTETMNFKELTDDEVPLYYGICQYCCPATDNRRNNYATLQIKTVEKRCVENGNIVHLTKEMFKCDKCERKERGIVEFKKCPHCGIKTVKPDGCNFVQCGDHRWCFLCNERLPNNHEGHNVHYWMGPGTGPYSDSCRKLANYNAPNFILHSCDCRYCSKRNGAPLCRNIDCYNECGINHYESRFKTYCQVCTQNPY